MHAGRRWWQPAFFWFQATCNESFSKRTCNESFSKRTPCTKVQAFLLCAYQVSREGRSHGNLLSKVHSTPSSDVLPRAKEEAQKITRRGVYSMCTVWQRVDTSLYVQRYRYLPVSPLYRYRYITVQADDISCNISVSYRASSRIIFPSLSLSLSLSFSLSFSLSLSHKQTH